MELVDLNILGDALVGVPWVDGLVIGQRKAAHNGYRVGRESIYHLHR